MKRTVCIVSSIPTTRNSANSDTNPPIYSLHASWGKYLFHLLKNYSLADPRLAEACSFEHISYVPKWESTPMMTLHSGGFPIFPRTEYYYLLAKEISDRNPDVAGFSSYLWNVEAQLLISYYLKSIDPETTIILGGPELYGREAAARMMQRHPHIDIAVASDGELSLRQILLGLFLDEVELTRSPFVFYREAGDIVQSRSTERIKNLDEIPSPILSQTSDDFPALALNGGRIKFAATYMSRGCPFKCGYCAWRGAGGYTDIRRNSLDRALQELRHLRNCGVNAVAFGDSNLALSVEPARTVLEYLLHEFTECILGFEQDISLIPEALIPLFRELYQRGRLAQFDIGIQTANEPTMRIACRPSSLKQFRKRLSQLDLTKPSESKLLFDFILGLPGDTYRDFLRTLDFLYDELLYPKIQASGFHLWSTSFYIGSLCLLPGSSFRDSAEALGLHYEPTTPYQILRTAEMSAYELRKARTIIASLDLLDPLLRLVMVLGSWEADFFERFFTHQPFNYTQKYGWEDLWAHRFFVCAQLREYVQANFNEKGVESIILDAIDFLYLHAGTRNGPIPDEFLFLPSLVSRPRSKESHGPSTKMIWTARSVLDAFFIYRFANGIRLARLLSSASALAWAPIGESLSADSAAAVLLLGPQGQYLLSDAVFRLIQSARFKPVSEEYASDLLSPHEDPCEGREGKVHDVLVQLWENGLLDAYDGG